MPTQSQLFPDPAHDPLLKLRDVEAILRRHFHRESMPRRLTIIHWIEEGTLIGIQLGQGRHYYVFESSINRFIEKISAARAA